LNKLKNKKAFTIIELIIIMAIIAVLVLLATPKFIGYTQKAKTTRITNDSAEIEKASERYYLDIQDWPRLTDKAYTAEKIISFAQEIKDKTGKIVTLDSNGSYYDIDYYKLQTYMQKPVDAEYYIIQNPVGNVYYLSNLTQKGATRLSGESIPENTNLLNVEPNITTFVAPISGRYKLEVWGGKGGGPLGANGGYAIGEKQLDAGQILYVYVDIGKGYGGANYNAAIGGGASDIRTLNGSWDELSSLQSRILVAGGGGGGGNISSSKIWGGAGGLGGGLIAGNGGGLGNGKGGTQTSGGLAGSIYGTNSGSAGSLGQGGSGGYGGGNGSTYGGGAGGGYYGGGGSGGTSDVYGGGGGSSYIGGVENGKTTSGINNGIAKASITYIGQ